MVYVNPDGTITTTQPWGVNKIVGLFFGAISFVVLFFKSLVGLDGYSSSTSSGSSRGSGGSGGGSSRWFGGGGGGGGGRGGRGPGPKRFFTMRDIAPPSVGGCAGGSCPR